MIGMLPLCNEYGFQLRSCSLPGRMRDDEAIRDLVGVIADSEWVRNATILPWVQQALWQGC